MINLTSAQIIVTSTSKAADKAAKTGKLNMDIIGLYNLIAYYVEFTRGREEYNQEHAFLLDKLITLRYDFPDILCNYKGKVTTYTSTVVVNTAPSVEGVIVDLFGNESYQFTVADFTDNYSDAQNQPYKYLLVNPATQPNGGLKTGPSGETDVIVPIIFDIEGLNSTDTINLWFKRDTTSSFTGQDFVTFRISDNPEDYLYSAEATNSIQATLASGEDNLPATIGDNTIYVDNRAVTILTLPMFTSQLTPPYNDPEADLIDAIRIDEISTANVGVFKLNGTEISENDIITREDLNAGLFTHEGPDQDAISSDVFNFSARDEGSQIWVQ